MPLLSPTRLPAYLCAIITLLFAGANGLRCFQGQQNATLPVDGSATECPISAMSCTKSVEPSLKIATRGCQQANCSLNGVMWSEGVCQNSSFYPFTTYCCCYGDGCNSATSIFTSVTQLLSVIFVTIVPLCIGQFCTINKHL